ncbi:cytochrome P450 [Frankia casuarinae]|uniref:Cytochrome P450 n=1 Tax=Frankia casuarinae (strain DSM 45818 / CECT 9043 / HFP020203 / CcI3) TaxID=106370 RepID=Q2J4I2_FRACC|nr:MULTISPECIES: cytochrome P450 [Frankia]ABD13810.1 cytochrome P450 [Frankia casuarinae]EYT94290.1 cytochrome P450 [Frankia casuarinae]KEZ37798.1 cytochrome P450 [Frankia sp. CeD]ORT48003.1 cytochrome P450 [Frankia sp. KB5]TFE34071.1 cytochrome P450 [Frankia sp. B2]
MSRAPHVRSVAAPPSTAKTSDIKTSDRVPGSGEGPVEAIRRLRADPLTRLNELARAHGPVVRLASWPVSAFLVTDPDAIADALVSGHRAYAKGAVRRGAGSRRTVVQPLALLLGQGLLTSAGDTHRQQRRLLQPLFHKQRIAGYADAFAAIADKTADGWRDGQRLDVHTEMTEMTLAIVARTLFDVDLDSHVVDVIRAALDQNMPAARRAQLPGFTTLERLPLPAPRRRRDARNALDRVVHDLIADRRATGATGNDLLSLLLTARDADTGASMDDSQVRDEALTLLLAGHETTANALTWTFHLLGRDPEVLATLQAELDRVLGERRPTIDDLPQLPYTNAVISEAMRLYPPVWAMGRHLVEDRDVAGYRLPAGSTLVFSQWVVHRDERWWPRPELFDPIRWTGPDTADEPADAGPKMRPRFAYFPFGAGPRQCIGNTFAITEGVLALAAIARRWSFTPVPGLPVTPQPLVTLRPKDGLPMIAHGRYPNR